MAWLLVGLVAGREAHDPHLLLDKVKVTKPFLFLAARQLLYVVGQQNFCMVHILALILEGKGGAVFMDALVLEVG